jgi:TPR repeat protein
MTLGEETQSGLIRGQSTAFSRVGAKSLIARGHKELRITEEAGEWLRKGLELRKMQKHDEGLVCFKRGLEIAPEDPSLHLCFAETYYWGYGVPCDSATAMHWFCQPAEQGHAVAQCMLASLYEAGDTVTQDLERAVYWYRRSAEQGLRPGQSALARAASVGSVQLPLRASEADFWRSHVEGWADLTDESILASLDPHGLGVPDDLKEALDWYRRAVEQRHGEAQYVLWQLCFA